MLVHETRRGGKPVGDIWNDYNFELPASDKKASETRELPECRYQQICFDCAGKRIVTCTSCHGYRNSYAGKFD